MTNIIKFQYLDVLLNGDLPLPPEAAPFCINITKEWLEAEGYDSSAWIIYKGFAFRGRAFVRGFVYKGKVVLSYEEGGRKSSPFTKERIDQIADLSEVSSAFISAGYVPEVAGHDYARSNFIGVTLDPHWIRRADWDAAASRSRQDWWEMLPPIITEPVIDHWLKTKSAEINQRVDSLIRWQSEAIKLKNEFPEIELIYSEDSFLSQFPDLVDPPRIVHIVHPRLPFPMISALDARKYLST